MLQCLINPTAKKSSWSREFSQSEVASAVEAVSPANCFNQYVHAQGHDLFDVLNGEDLSGEVRISYMIQCYSTSKMIVQALFDLSDVLCTHIIDPSLTFCPCSLLIPSCSWWLPGPDKVYVTNVQMEWL